MSFKEELALIPENSPAYQLRGDLAYERCMRKLEREPVIPVWVQIVLGLFMLGILYVAIVHDSTETADRRWRLDAVKRGLAHWEVSTEGDASWHWNGEDEGK